MANTEKEASYKMSAVGSAAIVPAQKLHWKKTKVVRKGEFDFGNLTSEILLVVIAIQEEVNISLQTIANVFLSQPYFAVDFA